MEIGVIVDGVAKITKTIVTEWLASHVEVYNELKAYNESKTIAFPNDPLKLKCYIPTRINSVVVPTNTITGSLLDDDTLLLRGYKGTSIVGPDMAPYAILTEWSISSNEKLDEWVFGPMKEYDATYANGLGYTMTADGLNFAFNADGYMFKTTGGYAWVTNSLAWGAAVQKDHRYWCGVQYTNDNFETSTLMTVYPFPASSSFRLITARQDGDNVIMAFVVQYYLAPTYSILENQMQKKIVEITYDTVANTSSIGTELIPSFQIDWRGMLSNKRINISTQNVYIKQFGDYSLIYGSYGYKTGYFLIDLTNTDPYWYYFDPVLFGLYSDFYDSTGEITATSASGVRDLVDIKKIGDIFYFTFKITSSYSYNNYTKTIADHRFIVYKMETV